MNPLCTTSGTVLSVLKAKGERLKCSNSQFSVFVVPLHLHLGMRFGLESIICERILGVFMGFQRPTKRHVAAVLTKSRSDVCHHFSDTCSGDNWCEAAANQYFLNGGDSKGWILGWRKCMRAPKAVEDFTYQKSLLIFVDRKKNSAICC